MRSILTEAKRKDKVSLLLDARSFRETKIDFPKDFRTIIGAHYGGVSLDLLFRQPFLMLRSLWHRLFESRCGIFPKSIKDSAANEKMWQQEEPWRRVVTFSLENPLEIREAVTSELTMRARSFRLRIVDLETFPQQNRVSF